MGPKLFADDSNDAFTCWLQRRTLVVETSGVLAIIPAIRAWIGLGLLAFYTGVLATFDYGFQFNALLTLIYFLPCEQAITRAAVNRIAARTLSE